MLSEEVLDSIQILKFLHDKCNSEKSIGMMQVYRVDELAKAIETILNFIEKQSKEIEGLKKKKFILNAETGEIKEIPVSDNYISKDKIKAKIEELEELNDEATSNCYGYGIHFLQSLLEKE